jgi:hypothetical protein
VGIGFTELLILVPLLVFPVWLGARIAARAGFSRWWGLAMLLPLVNLVLVWAFAFSSWPSAEPPSVSGTSQGGTGPPAA